MEIDRPKKNEMENFCIDKKEVEPTKKKEVKPTKKKEIKEEDLNGDTKTKTN